MLVDRNLDYRILLGIAVTAACAMLPFIVYHAYAGDWQMLAITATFAAIAAVGAVAVWLGRHSPRAIRNLTIVLALAGNAATVLAIERAGGAAAYWTYTILLANFYVLSVRAATAVNIAMCALVLALVANRLLSEYFYRFVFTLPICIAFALVFASSLTRQRNALREQARLDTLTGAGNRRGLMQALTEALEKRRRYGETASLVLFDIDRFKQLNDARGHIVGDHVLAEIAETVRQRIRKVDRLYRYGGEEFVVLLPHTPAIEAMRLAEDLRQRIEAHRFVDGVALTVSLGIAEADSNVEPDDWLSSADSALYQAKRAGRNTARHIPMSTVA